LGYNYQRNHVEQRIIMCELADILSKKGFADNSFGEIWGWKALQNSCISQSYIVAACKRIFKAFLAGH
jgi:hypothetical protein